VRPVLGGGLTHARAERRTIRGTTSVAWKLSGGTMTMDVEVPVHATARVYVPTAKPDAVKEGGRPAAAAPGVQALPAEPGYAVFEVGSGRYRFAAPR
jgi:alpha-L-rhamnosidase